MLVIKLIEFKGVAKINLQCQKEITKLINDHNQYDVIIVGSGFGGSVSISSYTKRI